MIGQGGIPLLCCSTCYDQTGRYVVMQWQSDASINKAIRIGYATCLMYCPCCGHLVCLPDDADEPEDTPDEWPF